MADIATAKQTGGGGFDFEDKVTAYFLGHLLLGKFPLQSELGLIERVDFQVRPLGWLFDDLLLTMNNGKITRKIAVSAKSNRQITANGFPDDILTDIWKQYLNDGQQVFDQRSDHLLFIVSPIARSVSQNLSTLINTAKVTSPKDMIERLSTRNFSAAQKLLFNSLKCPATLRSAYKVPDEEICKLLQRILVKEFDFQSNSSNDEVNLIAQLQGALVGKQTKDAQYLYTRLAGLRKEYAPYGGYIDLAVLRSKISAQFKLSGLEEHDEDWIKIGRYVKGKLDNIPDLLGHQYAIERKKELSDLTGMLATRNVIFLLGPSGSGKTVLAKKMTEQTIAVSAKAIWFDAPMLMSGEPGQLFNITHSLNELLTGSMSMGNLLVIDGADRLYKKEYVDTMASLIREVLKLTSGHWNILITSQQDDYEELIKKLGRSNLAIPVSEIYDLKAIDMERLLDIGGSFPQMTDLIKHQHLLKLLGNLKFLDLVIFNISKENSRVLLKDIGESHLIDWIWQQEILDRSENGAANSRFLQVLAEKQANELTLFTPATEFQIAESGPISELKQLKVIAENEDRLYFTHDLFGDWARYKMIRANKDKILEYLPKVDLFSPLWCKAIRLYGIYLLEKKHDPTEWLETYRAFDRPDPQSKMIQNLLLESIIFSNDTDKYLEDLWDDLKKDKAKILNDFFEQFFFKATLPNPAVLQLAGKLQGITISQLATYNRIPKFVYWMPILGFIAGRVDELISLSMKSAIRLAKDWLGSTPPGMVYRDTAAELGVKIGKWLIAFKESGGYAFDHSGKQYYQVMLMAFREQQAEVKKLALMLAGKIQPPEPKKKERGDRPMFSNWNPRKGTVLPNGPLVSVDDDFQEACLESDDLVAMMQVDPELAEMILLAVLISEPENVQDPASYHFKYDIHEPLQWSPPFYTRGPFLNFFRTAPANAVNFTITLTNFATDEWKLEQQARKEPVTFITLDLPVVGKKEFYGDNRVYYWFRDIGNAPNTLISNMMAMEKYLIEIIDGKKEPEGFIKQILENSNSLAMIGLLSSVGRYSRKLFLTALKPLLACFELYELEKGLDFGAFNIEGHQTMGSGLLDSTTRQLSWEWHHMPHRKSSIKSIALPLMLSHQEIHDLFKNTIIPEWSKLENEYTKQGYVDAFLVNMIAQFKSENYVAFQNDDGVGLMYQEPGEVTQQLEQVRSYTDVNSDEVTFAFTKQRDLEQHKQYDLLELESIWLKIQGFYAKPEGDLFAHHNQRLSNVFAGIGILIDNKEKLITSHPEYFEWISTVVTEVLEKLTFDLRESTMVTGPSDWEGFAANFVPRLFAENPENKVRRKWMGTLALNFNNEAVGRLFKATSDYFKFSDHIFIRLQNLMIQRAHIVRSNLPNQWGMTIDWNEKFRDALNAFVNEDTPASLTDICGFSIESDKDADAGSLSAARSCRRDRYVRELKDTAIDLSLLFPALQFPPITSITDEVERTYILDWYRKLIELQTNTWGPITDNQLPLDISLHAFDHWLILRLSELLPKVSATEAANLWQPLMAYGNLSAKWLISFLDNLLIYNYQKPENYEVLGKIWNEMIDFAFTQATWKNSSGYHHDHWELWQGILGISRIQIEVWKLGYQDLLYKFSDKTINFMIRAYTNKEVINKLAILLRSPGADHFIIPGVLLIAAHLKFQDALDQEDAPSGMVRVPFDHYDSVANTCSYLWSEHKQKIKEDGMTFLSFKDIVIYLVAIQNPIGLDLQDRLIE